MNKKKKGTIELYNLVYIILGLLALLIAAVIYMLVSGKTSAAADFLRDLLRLQ